MAIKVITKRGGGLCIYVHDSLQVKKLTDISVTNFDIEMQFIEILNSGSKNILIGNIYRPLEGR